MVPRCTRRSRPSTATNFPKALVRPTVSIISGLATAHTLLGTASVPAPSPAGIYTGNYYRRQDNKAGESGQGQTPHPEIDHRIGYPAILIQVPDDNLSLTGRQGQTDAVPAGHSGFDTVYENVGITGIALPGDLYGGVCGHSRIPAILFLSRYRDLLLQ